MHSVYRFSTFKGETVQNCYNNVENFIFGVCFNVMSTFQIYSNNLLRANTGGVVSKPTLTVGGEAAGSAAVLRAVSAVMLQQLRASALRFLRVHVQSREAPDPAVPVVGSRGARGLGVPNQTQDGQEPPRDDHRAIVRLSVTST